MAFEILYRRVESPIGQEQGVLGLEEAGGDAVILQHIRLRRILRPPFVEFLVARSVRHHVRIQQGSPRTEGLAGVKRRFGILLGDNRENELGRRVAVEPRHPEGVYWRIPARSGSPKINNRCAWRFTVRRCLQNDKNGRVAMVVVEVAVIVEALHIVLVWV